MAVTVDEAGFRKSWRLWTKTIAGYARRRWTGGVSDPEEHAKLHKDVLASCHALAAASTGEQKEFYEALAALVAPWGKTDALARTDAEILTDLVTRCEAAENRLEGRKPAEEGVPLGGMVLASVAVGVIVALAMLAFMLDWWLNSFSGRLREVGLDAWYGWRQLGETTQLAILGIGVFLLAVAVLARVLRR